MECKNNGRKQSIWFILSLLFLIASQAHAITTFTVNGEKSLTVDQEERVDLIFSGDTASPGGSLTLEIYLDFQGDGQIDPEDMIMPFGRFKELIVTDGIEGEWIGDEDGEANAQIVTTINMIDEPFEDLLFPNVIIRAVDEDGSFDSVSIHIKMPEEGQTVSGKVTDEDGAPIEGVPIIGTSLSFMRLPALWTAMANADGEYILSLGMGMVTVALGEKKGYYSELPIQNLRLAEGENKTDVDFVLKEDVTPPTIQHEPPENAIINNSLLLEAIIEDNESGIGFLGGVEDMFKSADFPIPSEGTMPEVYFRDRGSAGDFTVMMMYPQYDIEFPEPLPPFPMPMPEFDEAGDEGDEGVARLGEIGPDGGPILRNESKYQLLIPGVYITPAGLEYYIKATDRAKNATTSPPAVPNILHIVEAQTSPYVISGTISNPDGMGIADVDIHARAAYGFAGGMRGFADNASAKTDENGKYQLFLIAPGEWHLSILPPPKFYIASPKERVQVVQVEEEREYLGYDWVIAEDNQPPAIEHNPDTDVTASSVGEDVTIRAQITDDSEVTYARIVIVSELEFGYEDVDINEDIDPDFADIIAPPKPDEGNIYTFVIPAYRVTGDIEYFISAFDRVGNVATHPAENPREHPHNIKIKPAPYAIYGKVTADGEGLGYIPITVESNTDEYHKTMTRQDGTFSVRVSKGTWNIQQHAYGYLTVNPIEPVVIEAEGQYEVNIELAKDKTPPVIVHSPETDVTASSAGEDITIKATITDETNIYARIVIVSGIPQPFYAYDEDDEWKIGDVLPPEIGGDVKDVEIGIEPADEEGKVEPPNILPPGDIWWDWPFFSPEIDGDVYTFVIPGDLVTGDIEYFIEAHDSSGNIAAHPAENPREHPHRIEIQPAPYTIYGKVTVDTEGLAYISITAESDTGEYHKTMTKRDGTFSMPVGKGIWEIQPHAHGYFIVDPIEPVVIEAEGQYEVNIELARDNNPPVITHNPETDVTASAAGEDITIKATITDETDIFARIVIVSGIPQLLYKYDGDYDWGMDDVNLPETRNDVEEVETDVSPAEGVGEVNPPGILPLYDIWWDSRFRPEVDGNAYAFVIPGDLVIGDIEYFIEARDSIGNVATQPAENPRLNPHLIKVEPAPYSIAGKVTLGTADGEGLGYVVITATSDAENYRKTATKEDGTFSLPVKPGTWEIEAFMPAMVFVEPIDPVVVEDEGEYEVNIVLEKDEKPPIIVHTPLEKFVFGEAMKITVSVADDGRVAAVLIHISLDDKEIIFKAHLTADGAYTTDLIDIFHRFPAGKVTEIQYNVEASDATGNRAVSETYSALLEVPYTISGKVTVDGEQREGVRIFFDNEAVKSFADTQADGSYSIPAILGKNTITVERGYTSTDDSPLKVEIDVQPDQQYTDVNFELKQTGKLEWDDRIPASEEGFKEGWLRADVIGDQIINVADLVFIGKRFGEKIESGSEAGPNPDINEDGVVDIADLVLVAKHFGRILDASAAPLQFADKLKARLKVVPERKDGSTAVLNLMYPV